MNDANDKKKKFATPQVAAHPLKDFRTSIHCTQKKSVFSGDPTMSYPIIKKAFSKV